jgi:hypothetical protein
MNRNGQGLLFRIRLGSRWMTLWFLGVIPLGFIHLPSVILIQKADPDDYFRGGFLRWILLWRYWFWPSSPGRQPHAGHYLIMTRDGIHIWMRLRSGLHYQLREAVHRAKTGLG